MVGDRKEKLESAKGLGHRNRSRSQVRPAATTHKDSKVRNVMAEYAEPDQCQTMSNFHTTRQWVVLLHTVYHNPNDHQPVVAGPEGEEIQFTLTPITNEGPLSKDMHFKYNGTNA